MIWCLPSQITQQIAVGSGSGVFKSFLHILQLSGIHLLGQVCHLWGAPWILQDDQIVAVQTDGPLLFVLSKQVLHYVHVAQIPMMSGFGKQLCDCHLFHSSNHRWQSVDACLPAIALCWVCLPRLLFLSIRCNCVAILHYTRQYLVEVESSFQTHDSKTESQNMFSHFLLHQQGHK